MQYNRSYDFPYLRQLLLLFCALLLSFPVLSQLDNLWDESYGGLGWEELNNSKLTSDGGFILAGSTTSEVGADISVENQGNADFWILKVGEYGNKEWDARFGGDTLDRCMEVIQTVDGGFLFAGNSHSGISGNKTTPNLGLADYWMIKTDDQGNKQWERNFGGEGDEFLMTVIQTPDGGYLLGGFSTSGIGPDKSEDNRGGFDYWIVKTDAEGEKEWDKTLGGDEEERLNYIAVATDGNYLLGGSTQSDANNDVSIPSIGIKDMWFVKVSSVDGSIIWQRRYGGELVEEMTMFEENEDGSFLLVGSSSSNASVWKSENSKGLDDMWAIKIDAQGNKLWDKTIGGTSYDFCNSFLRNSGGFYLLGGISLSDVGEDKTDPSYGGWDYWVVAIDSDGQKVWDKTIGGNTNDAMIDVFQHKDGNYILAGHSSSEVSGDKTDPSNGLNDFWVVRTLCDLETSLPDTSYCYGDEIVIDANDFNNFGNCYVQWSDGTNSSTHLFNGLTSQEYYLTITNSDACERFDTVFIDVNPLPDLDLGSSDQGLCLDSTLELSASSSDPGTYLWSTGQTMSTINVDEAGTYGVTVTSTDGCTQTDEVNIFFVEPPTVNFGNDIVICPNESVTFDAGGTGYSYNWIPAYPDEQIGTFILDTTTLVSVQAVSETGCVGADTVLVNVIEIPTASVSDVACGIDNHTYTIEFTVEDLSGDGFEVYGDIPFIEINDSTFSVENLGREESFTFSITNNSGCDPFMLNGEVDDFCPCLSEAGQIVDTTIFQICDNAALEFVFSDQFLDDNDTVNYILHDGSVNEIGNNVYTLTNEPILTYVDELVYGQVYYYTAVVGNHTVGGLVNYNEACIDYSEGYRVRFVQSPIADIVTQSSSSISCNVTSVVLSGEGSSSTNPLFFDWNTNDGNFLDNQLNEPVVEVDSGGVYQLIVEDELLECSDTAMFEVISDITFPNVEITSSGDITCSDSIVVLDAHTSSNGSNFVSEWSGQGIDGETDLLQLVNTFGTFTLTITDNTNGCQSEGIVDVFLDNTPADVELDSQVYLDCETGQATLTPLIGGENYSFNWIMVVGDVLPTEDTLNIVVNQPGVYALSVFNPENGCIDTLETNVLENTSGDFIPYLSVDQPACIEDLYGNIIIDSIQGGKAPYRYVLNGENVSPYQYQGLSVGEYFLSIVDSLGCTFEDTIQISQPEDFSLKVVGDQAINLGDSLELEVLFTASPDSFFWSESPYLSCLDCPVVTAKPLYTSQFVANAFNENNCFASDTVVISLTKNRGVFIPNAISPNNDGINDKFIIYGDQSIEIIESVMIFDRWGAILHESSNTLPNNPLTAWDGKFKNGVLPTGVYVYVIKILFKDGHQEIYSGDLTVIK